MANLIQSQPAYLLHSRPYRDTSLLVDFITQDFGRIRAVAKGVRSPKSRTRALLQPFIPLIINLSGKSELKTLGQVESQTNSVALKHKALFAAMYVNELLVRLIHKQESDIEIFSLYAETLIKLSVNAEIEPVLRSFELNLLELLGYGIDFSVLDELAKNDKRIHWYYFHHDSGFERVNEANAKTEKYFSNHALQQIADRNFIEPETQKSAKRLLRAAFSAHLGDKPLSSRNLFRKNNG
ncbi:MAG: DNA repair protein RecO [SAR86 cluster bacterium]|uniref:DNA repair protein RecO n=1 Tax=SAR86 cluster bacterium TaxID=2030880 RepID=A0A2A5C802_9GAMM|nr:MAG: DNA repair protein RecO [SAR86 cluster bacterium]